MISLRFQRYISLRSILDLIKHYSVLSYNGWYRLKSLVRIWYSSNIIVANSDIKLNYGVLTYYSEYMNHIMIFFILFSNVTLH